MDLLSSLRDRLTEPLVANLLAAAGLVVAILAACWVLRRLVHGCGCQLTAWTGSHRLGDLGKEAAHRARCLLLRLALVAVALTLAGGLVYHLAGGNARADLGARFADLTPGDLLEIAVRGAGFVLLLPVAWAAGRGVRRGRQRLEGAVSGWLTRAGNEADVRRWFGLLEQFAVAAVVLGAAWAGARILALPDVAAWGVGLVVRLVLILAGVRLLPLAAHVLLRTAADLGDRHLAAGRPYRYWERVRRLFPFAQRCLEAAIHVYAASLAVRELRFIDAVADYGTRVVACIGIFFGCRVAIELSQVLLNEAFGLYDERRPVDQKGQTLVPLLQSVCQYALYFGSVVVMLGVLGINTGPILAGAGLLGLAVGLGAQSLVTDVVSGFFILFEEQYLVGDHVKIGEASGRVEAVGIRHTQVRDAEGRLHIIPNGQIKGVVNASRGYSNALVEVRFPADADLGGVLEAMREAGRRLRREHPDVVLADTDVQGLADLTPAEMTVRAVTRVRPGTHGAVANEYRRLLREVLDERRLLAQPRRAA
jgi:moderate conductance mechanosensitive channel